MLGVVGTQVPMVKPGDASMASPFTAKASGVMPCTDIVRQGRATLVTTVQMFKILGLLCLQTAYSLSVQYLQVSNHSQISLTQPALVETLTGPASSAKTFSRIAILG